MEKKKRPLIRESRAVARKARRGYVLYAQSWNVSKYSDTPALLVSEQTLCEAFDPKGFLALAKKMDSVLLELGNHQYHTDRTHLELHASAWEPQCADRTYS